MKNKYFPLPLDVRWLDGKLWLLLAPFEYHRRNGEVIRAEESFVTDFGTKPWLARVLVGSPTDEGGQAYVIHDWLCVNASWPKKKTDRIFFEALRDSDVAYLKRMVMYFFVCIWSWLTKINRRREKSAKSDF